MVKNIIIPSISRLKTQCPLPFSLLIPARQLAQFSANEHSLCDDLDLSDRFFDSLKLK